MRGNTLLTTEVTMISEKRSLAKLYLILTERNEHGYSG
jgi:hypothetical protein